MKDVLDRLPPMKAPPAESFGPAQDVPLGKIQQITAQLLHRNYVGIPHVTHNDEVDVTDLETRRKAWNAANPSQKLTPLVPIMKAMAACLKEFPRFNAQLGPDGTTLVLKSYVHIGVAVDTPNGLLVGVVQDVDKKSPATLDAEVKALAQQAREKGLSMKQMTGASMTVSSLGHIGGTSFSPIINSPEVAILGVTRLTDRPARGEGDQLIWRQMLPLSLSYDHRVINGADAARFCVAMGQHLADFTPEG